MRLKQSEIDAIKRVTTMVFGENANTLLFGSRTNDNIRGGDIDLCIQYKPGNNTDNLIARKIEFLVQLKKIIGDQKIDVLIDTGKQTSTIFSAVRKEGILL